jgi:hypothetical protein
VDYEISKITRLSPHPSLPSPNKKTKQKNIKTYFYFIFTYLYIKIWNIFSIKSNKSEITPFQTQRKKRTRCIVVPTRVSSLWLLRRLTNVSPFFNSLSNRLRITNYCLRSVSSGLLKFTRFIQGNNIAWTNLDMIRNLQHLHMNKKQYTYKTLPFNSHWIFFWIKSVMWSE